MKKPFEYGIGFIEKADIEIQDKYPSKIIKIVDPVTKEIKFEITAFSISSNIGIKPPLRLLKKQELPYIITARHVTSKSDDNKFISCDNVLISTQERWFKQKVELINKGKKLLPPDEIPSWNPFNDDILEKLKLKMATKEDFLQEDYADINKMIWELRKVITE